MSKESIQTGGESATVVLLNGHCVKIPLTTYVYKHRLKQNSGFIRQRFPSGQQLIQSLTAG